MNIEKYLNHSGIFQYKIIDTESIPFSQSVVDACRANVCGRYGTCWTCPPGVGTMEELKAKILSYKKAAVFTCKYDLEDCFDFEGMAQGAKSTGDFAMALADTLRQDNVDFKILSCEGCGICDKCTYPDAPCRFPDKAFASVEACGINVVQLSRDIGVNYNNGADTVTYFSMILFDR